jgi:hypothetical protein
MCVPTVLHCALCIQHARNVFLAVVVYALFHGQSVRPAQTEMHSYAQKRGLQVR